MNSEVIDSWSSLGGNVKDILGVVDVNLTTKYDRGRVEVFVQGDNDIVAYLMD
jgi:hypothetical protein